METVRVGGRAYSDPDIISLIKSSGGGTDPRLLVLREARRLLAELALFEQAPENPIKRLTVLASFRGITVEQMDIERQRTEKRDAILLPTGSKRIIVFNPARPPSRVAFTIAHEISHSFFPNSLGGARFRSICHSNSKEASELERLCDLGASELLMPAADFQKAAAGFYNLQNVERLCSIFGSSYEATVFRLATAYPGIAVSGLLRYRVTVKEERRAARSEQGLLFGKDFADSGTAEQPKYRRQSVYLSESCTADMTIRWNKSFDETSCVYAAGTNGGIHLGHELLPNGSGVTGRLEAVRAPYQGDEAHPEFADVLFFWTAT